MIRAVGTRSSLEGFSHRSRFISPLSPGFAFNTLATASADLEVAATGVLTGSGSLEGSAALTVTPSATAGVKASVSASVGLSFSTSADLADKPGRASASIFGSSFSSISFLTGTGELTGSADITFGAIGRDVTQQNGVGRRLGFGLSTYNQYSATYLQPDSSTFVLVGTAEISFSSDAELTTAQIGSLDADASITFSAVGDPSGTGELGGVTDVAFSGSGTVINAAANQMVASAALTFGETAALDGRGYIEGSSSITITVIEADVSPNRLEGSTSITLAANGTASQKLQIAASESITFSTDAEITSLGPTLEGQAGLSFATAGDLIGIFPLAASAGLSFTITNAQLLAPGDLGPIDKPGQTPSGPILSIGSGTGRRNIESSQQVAE